ncbi:hypothetical protein M9Y10_038610 [Tritrichomonas musculus]|uniref:Ubiquitin-like domain-containing protein n=1 Tax=Tritrichomonas musculus TaxID=1915356 RepID=A0ABR2K8X3_9EUKA
MKRNYSFDFPDGYTYQAKLDPNSTIGQFIQLLKGIIFKEDEEMFDMSVQSISLFYSGVFLNEAYKFSEIKYKDGYPLKVYIKATPEACKAKSLNYKDLISNGFQRKELTEDEIDEKIIYEDNKIGLEADNKVKQELKKIMPEGLTIEVMILLYVNLNCDIDAVQNYFNNALK